VGEASGPRRRGMLFQNRIRERRTVRTGASEQQVINRGGQFVEELREALEVGNIEGCSTRGCELTRYLLKTLEIPRGEHKGRALCTRQPGGFEADAGGAANHESRDFWITE
jgi:hypothetical protein